jgi:DNA-binding transcriptional MocR family regulator
MSLEAMNWAWEQPVAKSTNKLVRLALADHANADGECWPSMKRIAERSDISARHVSRAINELVELGLIEKASRRRFGGQYRGWDYRVLVQRTPASSGHPSPMTSGHPRPSPADTGVRSEPSENHQEEPLAPTAQKAVKKRQPDPLWDTMLNVCGINPQTLTGTERGRVNRALKELREVNATPEDIRARANAYKTKYPGAALTPTALAANWSQLTPARHQKTNVCRDCGQQLDRHDQETCDAFRRR